MLVTKTIEIDMGHRVPNHESKCKNPHGHRYRVELGVDDKLVTKEGASNEGMVIDFSELKRVLVAEVDEKYDHSFTIYENDDYAVFYKAMQREGLKINLVKFIPTAEKLAEYWYNMIKVRLDSMRIQIHHVTVYETPTSTATYTGV